jgi:membrane protein YdbS with pleckstrin-like domain
MSVNVGTFDRVLRLVVGLLLAIAPFATDIALFQGTVPMAISVAIGAVLVLTALVRVCPLYALLGMKTCRG